MEPKLSILPLRLPIKRKVTYGGRAGDTVEVVGVNAARMAWGWVYFVLWREVGGDRVFSASPLCFSRRNAA